MNLRRTTVTRCCRHLRSLLPPSLLPKLTTRHHIQRVYLFPARMPLLQHSLHHTRASSKVYQQSPHSKLFSIRRLSVLATSGQPHIKMAKRRHNRAELLLSSLLCLIINPCPQTTLDQRLVIHKTSNDLPTYRQLITHLGLTPHRTGTNNQPRFRIFLLHGHSRLSTNNYNKIRTYCRP